MAEQPCDFCGAPVAWTPDQIILDLQLRLKGIGLGVMCDDCGEKQARAFEAEVEHG